MEEKKKTNTAFIVIIILLIIIILLLVGYIFFIHPTMKNEPKETETKEEIKEEVKPIELTEAEVESYWKIIKTFTHSYGEKYPINTKNLDNQDILSFVWLSYNELTGKNFEDGVTKEDVENAITSIFGKDYPYTIESIDCFGGDGVIFEYNAENATFARVGTHGHGGASGVLAQEFFVSAQQTEEELTINTKILYGGTHGHTWGPTYDFYASAPFDHPIYQAEHLDCSQPNTCETYETVYPKVKDQLPITAFVFKKQSDGGFGLSEVRIED